MDIDLEVGVKHTWSHERPYKVTLTRGAKGVYRWEIEVRGERTPYVLEDILVIDKELLGQYAPIEPTETPPGPKKSKKKTS